ncbi:MAG: ABC transporter permease [Oscillospiraceae bacterium]
MKKILNNVFLVIAFLFLYAPIFVMIVFSFNESKSRANFTNFTFKWYKELFQNDLIINSFFNTLFVAVIASIVATLIGTIAAVGISGMKKRSRGIVMNMTYIPVINPEIVTGISLMMFLMFIGGVIGVELGFWSVLISHITFCMPYVVLNVLPKLRQVDTSVYEAAVDLGCSPFKAFFKAVLPEIMPGIFSGFLMAFTFSLDDFVITYFTSGSSYQTLPVTIYAMTRKKVSPEINALSTIMFLIVLALLLIMNIHGSKASKKEKYE